MMIKLLSKNRLTHNQSTVVLKDGKGNKYAEMIMLMEHLSLLLSCPFDAAALSLMTLCKEC